MEDSPVNEQAQPSDPAQSGASEEELRAQLEEELRKVRIEEVVLQSTASIVNLTARRIAKEDERDLEQARVGIEAVRALTPLLPEEVQPQIRNALSELQVLYARAAGGGDEAGGEGAEPSAADQPPRPEQPPQPSPSRQPPPKLWTPPGSS